METTITKEARDELIQAVRQRYWSASSRSERKQMLHEFIALTGCQRAPKLYH